MKIMTFHLSDELYAVELSAVSAVARSGESGEMPLLELAERLGFGRPRGNDGPVLVLRDATAEAGIRVERLGEVLDLDQTEMRAVPHYFGSPLLRGVAQIDEGVVVLLDGEELLRMAAEEIAPIRQPEEVR